jgi:hypothetical protein
MTENVPISCSLSSTGLRQRLDEIAALGSESLTGRDFNGGRHRLRFRPTAEVRRRLEGIVAAESECCSFLDLRLNEECCAVVLTVAAPPTGQAIADELAAAFATDRS